MWRSIRSMLACRRSLSVVASLSMMATAPIAGAAVFDFYEGENVDFDFSTRRGLRLRIEEPDLSFRIGGRLHLDGGFADADRTSVSSPDGEIRRGRLYLRGRVGSAFHFMVDRELAPNRTGWRNLWGEVRPLPRLRLRAGNFVAPFGLEDITASNHSTFAERAVSASLAPTFQSGLLVRTHGRLGSRKTRNRWTLNLAATTSPLGEASDDRHRTDHVSLVSRITFAPIAKRGRVVHFGAAVEHRWVDGGSRFRIATRNESVLLPTLLNTSRLSDVDTVTNVGVESVVVLGPFSFQAEYMQAFLDRSNGRGNPSFPGGYAQIAWVVTGESRRYSRSSGLLLGLDPRSRWGAVELGARFSGINLNDETVRGGEALGLTLGANWYLQRNVRLMFNYVYADVDPRSGRPSEDVHAAQARFLIFF